MAFSSTAVREHTSAALRCRAQFLRVAMREFAWGDQGPWVGWGKTRPDCTFTAAGQVGGPGHVRLEAIVAGVGPSNIVTIRPLWRPALKLLE